jgi:hypothetical protein
MAADLPVIDADRQAADDAIRKALQEGVKKRVTIAAVPQPVPFDVLWARVAALEARVATLEKGNA